MGGCASKTDDQKQGKQLEKQKNRDQTKQKDKVEEKREEKVEDRRLSKQAIEQKRQSMRNNLREGHAEPPSSHKFQQVPIVMNHFD